MLVPTNYQHGAHAWRLGGHGDPHHFAWLGVAVHIWGVVDVARDACGGFHTDAGGAFIAGVVRGVRQAGVEQGQAVVKRASAFALPPCHGALLGSHTLPHEQP